MSARYLLPLWPLLLIACGGSQAPTQVATSPFLDEHEPMFENGIDMVRDPEALGGAWYGTWQDELDARITNADVVALVTVDTLRTDLDLDRNETYRLHATVDNVYLGELGETISLAVRNDEPGYGTVENNQSRLLERRFFAYIKFQDTDDGVRPRWHLSPATEAVALETRRLLAARRDVQTRGTRRTVVVHRE